MAHGMLQAEGSCSGCPQRTGLRVTTNKTPAAPRGTPRPARSASGRRRASCPRGYIAALSMVVKNCEPRGCRPLGGTSRAAQNQEETAPSSSSTARSSPGAIRLCSAARRSRTSPMGKAAAPRPRNSLNADGSTAFQLYFSCFFFLGGRGRFTFSFTTNRKMLHVTTRTTRAKIKDQRARLPNEGEGRKSGTENDRDCYAETNAVAEAVTCRTAPPDVASELEISDLQQNSRKTRPSSTPFSLWTGRSAARSSSTPPSSSSGCQRLLLSPQPLPGPLPSVGTSLCLQPFSSCNRHPASVLSSLTFSTKPPNPQFDIKNQTKHEKVQLCHLLTPKPSVAPYCP
ncbi:uncharacterized protein LOC127539599 [Antechinus flavipes]|uniref:uncharacterized protein LOC127539599 n=1 Tax=Antechinus flavipes TaxID=38775 RepID=UPI002235735B|nr:uncharacterized protein LOC127539599 [Antechinus flavipes]XP_051819725.1 uncharacterized protein LOC127539599 [Antechinus flavipes]